MKSMIGKTFEVAEFAEEIICNIETENQVIVNRSQNGGYDWIAYENTIDSTQYIFVCDEEENEYGDTMITVLNVSEY